MPNQANDSGSFLTHHAHNTGQPMTASFGEPNLANMLLTSCQGPLNDCLRAMLVPSAGQ